MAEEKKKTRSKRNRSAQKQARQAIRSRVRNRVTRSKIGAIARKMQTAPEQRKALIPAVYAEIDRAAKKGVIHKRAAARRKSRLAKMANKAAA